MNSSAQGYETLRQEILSGKLKPGEPLKERDLVARLGISRTPVREALRRLVADGLAEMRPRRSIVVSTYSEEELREIFELGSVLEAHVAAMAAAKATPQDVARLTELHHRIEDLVATSPDNVLRKFPRLDQEFHHAITDVARNSRIAEMLRQTMNMRLLTRVMNRYESADFSKSVDHHRRITEAIASGDPEGARQAMADHIGSSMAAINLGGGQADDTRAIG